MLVKRNEAEVVVTKLATRLEDDGTGTLSLAFSTTGIDGEPAIYCAGARTETIRQDDGIWHADLSIPGVAPWWPQFCLSPRYLQV